VAGAVLDTLHCKTMQSWIPSLLALAAASMIYVAVADLIPGLHKRTQLRDTVQQVLLILLGRLGGADGRSAARIKNSSQPSPSAALLPLPQAGKGGEREKNSATNRTPVVLTNG